MRIQGGVGSLKSALVAMPGGDQAVFPHQGANGNPLMSVTAKFKQLRPLASKVKIVIDPRIRLPVRNAR